ncbi:MAG: hypothetical protein NXI07_07110, partial [bacterium]|nr:hypothetical protein [bacterium]
MSDQNQTNPDAPQPTSVTPTPTPATPSSTATTELDAQTNAEIEAAMSELAEAGGADAPESGSKSIK